MLMPIAINGYLVDSQAIAFVTGQQLKTSSAPNPAFSAAYAPFPHKPAATILALLIED
jgi:hypothetical protein